MQQNFNKIYNFITHFRKKWTYLLIELNPSIRAGFTLVEAPGHCGGGGPKLFLITLFWLKFTFSMTLCPSSQIFTADQTHFLNDPLSVVTDFDCRPNSLFE